jgi:type II secretory pathway pseudopilin PulG
MTATHEGHAALQRKGFTLAEAAISTVVVAVMMCAALASVAGTGRSRRIASEQQVAHLLGEQLMSEVLSKSYWDPAATAPTPLGASSTEKAPGNRSLFDDVDDYDAWLASPPQHPDGTALIVESGWYRSVAVAFVNFNSLDTPVNSDYGLKRISVEVGRVRPGGSASVAADRRPVATLVAIAGRGRGL